MKRNLQSGMLKAIVLNESYNLIPSLHFQQIIQ